MRAQGRVFEFKSCLCHLPASLCLCFLFLKKISLFLRDTESKAETQAEGEVGSLRRARYGTRSWILRSCPELKADTQPLSHPGVPVPVSLSIRKGVPFVPTPDAWEMWDGRASEACNWELSRTTLVIFRPGFDVGCGGVASRGGPWGTGQGPVG